MIKTGNKDLNEFIGSYSGMVLIYGAAGTGKTTLAKTAAIEQLKNKKKVIYIDTENQFNVDRFNQLSKGEVNLDNLFLFKINGFKDQQKRIKEIEKIRDKVSLIIIDTMNSYYRRMIKGHKEIADAMLNSQLRILKKLSKNIPVLITNQVYTDIETNRLRCVGENIFGKFCDCLIRLEKYDVKRILILINKKGKKEFLFDIREDGVYKI